MNRLRGMRCYEAGCIDRCPNGGIVWRKPMTAFLNRRGVIVIDPTDKPVDIGREDFDRREERKAIKEAGDYAAFSEIIKEIRRIDLRFVDISDFLAVYIDTDIYAWGTVEEISLANRQKKPILVWCEQGKKGVPDWLFGQIPHQHIFDSRNHVYEYLADIDEGNVVDDTHRWVFLKSEMLYNADVLKDLPHKHSNT